MKNCSKMEESVVAFARGKRLNALAAQQLRAHTASCVECQAKLANERALSMTLAALTSECAEAPSPLLEDRLRDAFRRESGKKAVFVRKRRLVAGFGIAAVAAILLAVAWIGTQAKKPVVDAQPKLAAQGRSDQLLRASSSTSTREPFATSTETAVKTVRQAAHKPQSNIDASQSMEEATEFMRIAYTDSVLPTEQVNVVRVQMPEAALAMYGLPVDGSHLDAKVYADVVVGQDGVARAIRFVR